MTETQTGTNGRLMTALFRDREMAEQAFQELLNRGYDRNDISVLMSEETRSSFASSESAITSDNQTDAEPNVDTGVATTIGSVSGGMIGTVLATVAAVATSVTLPGVGLAIAGPIVAALVGATAGSITGGIIGALVDRGLPEETARGYETGLQEGGIVLGFEPRSAEEATEVENVWQSYNAESLYR